MKKTKEASKAPQLQVSKEILAIRKKLKHYTTEAKPSAYLKTGSKRLNIVLGRKRGVPYGKLFEISGPESSGKSALCLDLIAIAQQDGAHTIWVDVENSLTASWAARRGVDTSKLHWLKPELGTFGKEKEERLMSAEELCTEAEELVKILHKKDHKAKIFMVVDSVAALLTAEEAETGLVDANMRTQQLLPSFLTRLLRRWVAKANSYNTAMVFVNQLRTNPMQRFGNPEYTPGGKALRFYCHVRARMRRVKGGRMMHSGKQVGIRGYIKNHKNKAGGIEQSEVGYEILFKGTTKFMDVRQVKKEGAGDDE